MQGIKNQYDHSIKIRMNGLLRNLKLLSLAQFEQGHNMNLYYILSEQEKLELPKTLKKALALIIAKTGHEHRRNLEGALHSAVRNELSALHDLLIPLENRDILLALRSEAVTAYAISRETTSNFTTRREISEDTALKAIDLKEIRARNECDFDASYVPIPKDSYAHLKSAIFRNMKNDNHRFKGNTIASALDVIERAVKQMQKSDEDYMRDNICLNYKYVLTRMAGRLKEMTKLYKIYKGTLYMVNKVLSAEAEGKSVSEALLQDVLNAYGENTFTNMINDLSGYNLPTRDRIDRKSGHAIARFPNTQSGSIRYDMVLKGHDFILTPVLGNAFLIDKSKGIPEILPPNAQTIDADDIITFLDTHSCKPVHFSRETTSHPARKDLLLKTLKDAKEVTEKQSTTNALSSLISAMTSIQENPDYNKAKKAGLASGELCETLTCSRNYTRAKLSVKKDLSKQCTAESEKHDRQNQKTTDDTAILEEESTPNSQEKTQSEENASPQSTNQDQVTEKQSKDTQSDAMYSQEIMELSTPNIITPSRCESVISSKGHSQAQDERNSRKRCNSPPEAEVIVLAESSTINALPQSTNQEQGIKKARLAQYSHNFTEYEEPSLHDAVPSQGDEEMLSSDKESLNPICNPVEHAEAPASNIKKTQEPENAPKDRRKKLIVSINPDSYDITPAVHDGKKPQTSFTPDAPPEDKDLAINNIMNYCDNFFQKTREEKTRQTRMDFIEKKLLEIRKAHIKESRIEKEEYAIRSSLKISNTVRERLKNKAKKSLEYEKSLENDGLGDHVRPTQEELAPTSSRSPDTSQNTRKTKQVASPANTKPSNPAHCAREARAFWEVPIASASAQACLSKTGYNVQPIQELLDSVQLPVQSPLNSQHSASPSEVGDYNELHSREVQNIPPSQFSTLSLLTQARYSSVSECLNAVLQQQRNAMQGAVNIDTPQKELRSSLFPTSAQCNPASMTPQEVDTPIDLDDDPQEDSRSSLFPTSAQCNPASMTPQEVDAPIDLDADPQEDSRPSLFPTSAQCNPASMTPQEVDTPTPGDFHALQEEAKFSLFPTSAQCTPSQEEPDFLMPSLLNVDNEIDEPQSLNWISELLNQSNTDTQEQEGIDILSEEKQGTQLLQRGFNELWDWVDPESDTLQQPEEDEQTIELPRCMPSNLQELSISSFDFKGMSEFLMNNKQ